MHRCGNDHRVLQQYSDRRKDRGYFRLQDIFLEGRADTGAPRPHARGGKRAVLQNRNDAYMDSQRQLSVRLYRTFAVFIGCKCLGHTILSENRTLRLRGRKPLFLSHIDSRCQLDARIPLYSLQGRRSQIRGNGAFGIRREGRRIYV